MARMHMTRTRSLQRGLVFGMLLSPVFFELTALVLQSRAAIARIVAVEANTRGNGAHAGQSLSGAIHSWASFRNLDSYSRRSLSKVWMPGNRPLPSRFSLRLSRSTA